MWSAEGTGSTFTLRLPVAAGSEGAHVTRILVVEDEESFRDALSYMLARRASRSTWPRPGRRRWRSSTGTAPTSCCST